MKKHIIFLIVFSAFLATLAAQDMTNIENYRIFKMSEYLELTPSQAETFFPLLRQYEKNVAEIAKQENSLYDALKARKGKNDMSEAELNRVMEQVAQFETQRTQLKQQFMQQSGKMLSPGQASRIPFFEKEFRNELKQQFIQRQNQQNQGGNKKPQTPGQGPGNPGGGGNPGQGGRP